MNGRKRYALVGTGSRAGMYVEALTSTYAETNALVGLCDLSQTRMDWYNGRLAQAGLAPIPTYPANAFERMIAETKPDTVIVTTMDRTHHDYIVRAMNRGCDVITEKPMTVDVDKLRAIFDAIDRTGQSLRVAFNYRYTPAYSRYRELIASGVIGRPLAVDFSWLLDTSHGADYFRRWHREKQNSGGLLVHKATHHFDLVNWWIGSRAESVTALGDLLFYGRDNAEARGERYGYSRYTGVPEAQADPFALFLDRADDLRGLYLDAEAESGYIRDRNVFGDPVSIEDTMCVSARYRSGALLSYSLIAYSPWEGLRVAVTGTKGRIELEVYESVRFDAPNGQGGLTPPSTGAFKQATVRVYPMFGAGYDVPVSFGDSGHGGADGVLLEQLFAPDPPPDPLHRAASHVDGAASILVGIAANQSMRTGQLVRLDDLFPLD